MIARWTRSSGCITMLVFAATMWCVPAFGQGFDPGGEFPLNPNIEILWNGERFDFEEGFLGAPRCLAHEISAPGQGWYLSGSGWYLSGSVRGLVPGPSVTVVDANGHLVTTESSGSPGSFLDDSSATMSSVTYRNLLEADESRDGTVAIFVADDFGGSVFALPAELWSVTPDSAGLSSLETLIANGKLTHGALVLEHLRRLVEATGLFDVESDAPEQYSWLRRGSEESRLVVVPVDLSVNDSGSWPDLIETSELVPVLSEALNHYSESLTPSVGDLNVVVNMSWVLLPCATVEDFIQAGGTGLTFEQYLDALTTSVDLPSSTHMDNLLRKLSILSWVPSSDPLHQLLSRFKEDSPGTQPTFMGDVFVAAAGNFSMTYQMVPAALPSVIGVGTPLQGQPAPEFSNAADVSAPGAWFNIDGVVSYAGTSYSAPFVSLFMALDLAGQRTCLPGWLGGTGPGLNILKSQGVTQARTLIGDAASSCGNP